MTAVPLRWGDPCTGTGRPQVQQLAGTVPPKLSITGAETKQQGEETARGTQLQGGMEWQKRLFSQVGCLQGLSLGHQESSKLLYFGLSV